MKKPKGGDVRVTKDMVTLRTSKAFYRVQVGKTYEPLNRAPEGMSAATV